MIPAGNYLLFGRTGTGKSSLINTIANAPIALTDYSVACTDTIAKYCFETPCGMYTMYDSPGLCEDDNPITDARYVSALKSFLTDVENQGLKITILLTVRIGSPRVRSEDHEVVKYLAELLALYPDIPAMLVATWANWQDGRETIVRGLDLLRIQYLLMLDKELLLASNRGLCIAGFSGSYAVDNSLGVWLPSWQPYCIEFVPRESYACLESVVGHPVKFITDWIESTGHSPEHLLQVSQSSLVNGRIFNLTQYPLHQDKSVPDLISISAESLAESELALTSPIIYRIENSWLSSEIDYVHRTIKERFGLRSSLDAKALSRNLIASLDGCINYLEPVVVSRGLSRSDSKHIVVLLAAREILYGLHFVAHKRSMHLLAPTVIVERMAVFAQILTSLFEQIDGSFLSKEIVSVVELTLVLPPGSDFRIVTRHLINSATILYLAVAFAEFSCFPRPRNDFVAPSFNPELDSLMDWLQGECQLHGASSMVLKCFEAFDWSYFSVLALDYPQCMRYLLEDIVAVMRTNQWLVSRNQIEPYISSLRLRFDLSPKQEAYWPSWRDEDDDNDQFPFSAEEGSPY